MSSYCLILVVYFLAAASAAPLKDDDDNVELHDQRQNGTENYRLDMKDVLIVFSPLETIISAAAAAHEYGIDLLKPPSQESQSDGIGLGHLALLADLKNNDGVEDDIPVYPPKQNRKW